MCGIAGIIGDSDEEKINKMINAMNHRGPDDSGTYIENPIISLGHKRLSIIDLTYAGHQPMIDEQTCNVLVYNGEIYNFKEIRRELEKKGYSFKSNTDTEVLLKAFIEWKEKCLDKFNGMFAFAIWQKKEITLFLARDRLGIKPLYYYNCKKENKFYFASQVKAILQNKEIDKKLNYKALSYYLKYNSFPQPYTLIENIYMFPPGHYGFFKDGELKLTKYWDIDFNKVEHIGYDEAKKEIKRLFKEAVERRLISDVPVGTFLSGGIDSTAITAIASKTLGKKMNTYSVGFGEEGGKLNLTELPYARISSKRYDTVHQEVTVTGKDVLENFEDIIEKIDLPSGDGVNTYFVSKAAKNGVTVALSGLGGDELFAGYPNFRTYKTREQIKKMIPSFLIKLIKFSFRISPENKRNFSLLEYFNKLDKEFIHKYQDVRSLFENKTISDMLNNKISEEEIDVFLSDYYSQLDYKNESDVVKKVSRLELQNYMRNVLLKDSDAMSMAHSLEVRFPFLDHKLIEFVQKLPSEYLLKGKRTKNILIDALSDLLPSEIINKSKTGFEIPMDYWLKNELRPIVEDVFSEKSLKKRDFFNVDLLLKIKQDFYDNKIPYMAVWVIVVLEYWLRKYYD